MIRISAAARNAGVDGDLILDNTDINEGQKVNTIEMLVSLPMSTE